MGGARLVRLSPSQAAVEHELRDGGPDRPEPARPRQPVAEARALEAEGGGERDDRKVRRLGDADLGVGGGHPALGAGDVGATLEQR